MLLLITVLSLLRAYGLPDTPYTTQLPSNSTAVADNSTTPDDDSASSRPPACPPHWWIEAGACYRVISARTTSVGWYGARSWCSSQVAGGDLASVTTQRLNQLLLDEGTQLASGELWIGFSDHNSENRWRWADGEQSTTFQPWGPGQPDNASGNQDCATLSLSNYSWAMPGEWDDDFCYTKKGGFVCQVTPQSW